MYKLSDNSSSFLDLLRFFAVQLVVIGHGISFCAILLFLQPPNFVYIQNVAVVLFFILSGFLISYSVYRKRQEESYSFSSYFIDRFSRIFTGLIPALLFILFIDMIYMHYYYSDYVNSGYHVAYNLKTFVGNIFMLQDFPQILQNFSQFSLGITSFGTGRPLWTLAIEWWIYMFFGWLILKDRIKMNTVLYIIILLAFSIVPIVNFQGGRGSGLFLMWLFGVFIFLMLAKFNDNIKKFFTSPWKWILICLLGSFGVLYIYSWEAYNLLYAFLLCLIILFMVLMLDKKKPFMEPHKKPIHFLASYSYTLYLIHYSIFALLINLRSSMSGFTIFILAFILSNACAISIAYFGEMRYKLVAAFLKKKFLKASDATPKQ